MRKIALILISIQLYACHDEQTILKVKDTSKKYDIESVIYWDIEKQKNDTIPFIVIKVDTINNIGGSFRYSDKGKIFERIIILDKKNAIKLDYENDTIVTSTICKYQIRKDHPTKEFYSILVGN